MNVHSDLEMATIQAFLKAKEMQTRCKPVGSAVISGRNGPRALS